MLLSFHSSLCVTLCADALQTTDCCELFGVIGTPVIVIIHPEGEGRSMLYC